MPGEADSGCETSSARLGEPGGDCEPSSAGGPGGCCWLSSVGVGEPGGGCPSLLEAAGEPSCDRWRSYEVLCI